MSNLGLFDGVGPRQAPFALGDLDELPIVSAQRPDLFLGQVLDVDEAIARAFERRDDLVELQMDGK
jgi:hypothetical protein